MVSDRCVLYPGTVVGECMLRADMTWTNRILCLAMLQLARSTRFAYLKVFGPIVARLTFRLPLICPR